MFIIQQLIAEILGTSGIVEAAVSKMSRDKSRVQENICKSEWWITPTLLTSTSVMIQCIEYTYINVVLLWM
jgi:hypothetical protein